ncbi:MaoC family dehydratase [Thalassospira marina]|uniref:Dehydratase n=1 Tax=Thalassospira marina TaxID=2048283 RepID=A0A2N3KMT1_9PROT|nr:MaoC/PaaZ C-terminal domain-containing protein [Thalassospira marina]AUG55922.1 dehydratase [Thalassospira marina]PKR51868.1 dehydratase [Thalassospira marina]
MEKKQYFNDYRKGDIRQSAARTVTEGDIVTHAGHTGDFSPHHMDAEYAKSTPFKQRIAHGTLVFSFGIGLASQTTNNPVAFSSGYDRVRFVRPVFIGDTLKTSITVTDLQAKTDNPDFGQVIERFDVLNQDGDIVLTADHVLMVEHG